VRGTDKVTLPVIPGKVHRIGPAPVIEIIRVQETCNKGKVSTNKAHAGSCLPEKVPGTAYSDGNHRYPVNERYAPVPDVEIGSIDQGDQDRDRRYYHWPEDIHDSASYVSSCKDLCMAMQPASSTYILFHGP